MSIQFPAKRLVSDRKYHEAGVRGRFENNLRIVRGLIDTTAPTIIAGKGFTVVRNAQGSATVTFDPPFSAPPSVELTIITVPNNASLTVLTARPVATAFTVNRRDLVGTNQDGEFSFKATGPA